MLELNGASKRGLAAVLVLACAVAGSLCACSSHASPGSVLARNDAGGGGATVGSAGGFPAVSGSSNFIPIDASLGDGGNGDEDAGPQPVDPGTAPTIGADVPASVVDQFGNARPVMDGQSPTLVYPTPETMFPPDIKGLLFQWQAPAGSVFRLHFGFALRSFDVFSSGADDSCKSAGLGASCWKSFAELSAHFLFEPGSTFTLQIAALDAQDPTKAHESPPYTFHLGPESALGAIYYWSTTLKGVRRGSLEDGTTADYLTPTTGLTDAEAAALTPDQVAARCVACHTLSRGGKHMSVALPGDQLGLVGITDASPPPFTYASLSSGAWNNRDPVVGASWVAFSPDENRIIAASQGNLSVHDVSMPNRAPLIGGGIELPAPGGVQYFGSMPDWAPDGKHIVFTATAGNIKSSALARHIRGSSIAWMSATTADPNSFENFEILAPSAGPNPSACTDLDTPDNVSTLGAGAESYANPMFSPDSQWLLYSRANCETERDPSAEIILTAAASKASPNHLLRANSSVGSATLQNLTNSMPTWGPRISSSGPHIAWVAFSSTRDFGLVLAPGTQILHLNSYPVRQLWIAAIDLDKAASGADPSYPAFRLPAQDYDENNHRPFWIHDALTHFTHIDPVIK